MAARILPKREHKNGIFMRTYFLPVRKIEKALRYITAFQLGGEKDRPALGSRCLVEKLNLV